MKMQYKVLWFEDQFEEVESYIEELEDIIGGAGFIPEIDRRISVSEVEINALAVQLDNYNPYDIIIFDYDLGANSEKGLHIAKSLRTKIYTDMIFYSGSVQAELRKMLFDSEVDGVFVVSRTDFINEVEPIIEDHIKRMSDINNIRGVVMSAMCGVDMILRDKFIEHLTSLDEEKQAQVYEQLKDRALRRNEQRKDKICEKKSADDLIKDFLVSDFDFVRIALKSLRSECNSTKELLKDNSLLHRLQRERNDLAHKKETYTEQGKMVLISPDGQEKEYNMGEFSRVRRDMIELHVSLGKI